MKTPVILIDCDGVLADFVGTVCRQLTETGWLTEPSDIRLFDVFSVVEAKWGVKAKEQVWEWMSQPRFWASFPTIEGAKEGVDKLRTMGRVVCVTSPWPDCHGWVDLRAEWLKTHFAFDRKDTIFTSAKELVAGDIFIDDKPDHVDAWEIAHPSGMAMLFRQYYNLTARKGRFPELVHWKNVKGYFNVIEAAAWHLAAPKPKERPNARSASEDDGA